MAGAQGTGPSSLSPSSGVRPVSHQRLFLFPSLLPCPPEASPSINLHLQLRFDGSFSDDIKRPTLTFLLCPPPFPLLPSSILSVLLAQHSMGYPSLSTCSPSLEQHGRAGWGPCLGSCGWRWVRAPDLLSSWQRLT